MVPGSDTLDDKLTSSLGSLGIKSERSLKFVFEDSTCEEV